MVSMSQDYGQSKPSPHTDAEHRPAARWLVLIDAAGVSLARFYRDDRHLVSEIDGGSEEVAVMTRGLPVQRGATGPEWNAALGGHTEAERRSASVYRLDV